MKTLGKGVLRSLKKCFQNNYIFVGGVKSFCASARNTVCCSYRQVGLICERGGQGRPFELRQGLVLRRFDARISWTESRANTAERGHLTSPMICLGDFLSIVYFYRHLIILYRDIFYCYFVLLTSCTEQQQNRSRTACERAPCVWVDLRDPQCRALFRAEHQLAACSLQLASEPDVCIEPPLRA